MHIIAPTIFLLAVAVSLLLPFEIVFLRKRKINLFKYGIPIKKKSITFSSDTSSVVARVKTCLENKKFMIESRENEFLFHNIGNDVMTGYQYFWGTISFQNKNEITLYVKAPAYWFIRLISSALFFLAGFIFIIQKASSGLGILSFIFLLFILFFTRFLVGGSLAKTKIEEVGIIVDEIESAIKSIS